eukprot:jgi/Psemu1/8987/gm1.8987_g
MISSQEQILQALQAKTDTRGITLTTNPIDTNPSVPPSQQDDNGDDDDGDDSWLFYDLYLDPDSETRNSKDDPANPGWERLLSLHGINRKRIPDWIIHIFSKMLYLPHPNEEPFSNVRMKFVDKMRMQFSIRARRTKDVARMNTKDNVDRQQSNHDRCALNRHANMTALWFVYGANTGDRGNYTFLFLLLPPKTPYERPLILWDNGAQVTGTTNAKGNNTNRGTKAQQGTYNGPVECKFYPREVWLRMSQDQQQKAQALKIFDRDLWVGRLQRRLVEHVSRTRTHTNDISRWGPIVAYPFAYDIWSSIANSIPKKKIQALKNSRDTAITNPSAKNSGDNQQSNVEAATATLPTTTVVTRRQSRGRGSCCIKYAKLL